MSFISVLNSREIEGLNITFGTTNSMAVYIFIFYPNHSISHLRYRLYGNYSRGVCEVRETKHISYPNLPNDSKKTDGVLICFIEPELFSDLWEEKLQDKLKTK